MKSANDPPLEGHYRHPVEAELDTAEEQAHALLIDLRDSFAPTYLTLISIIEGVLLGLTFQFLADGRQLDLANHNLLRVLNNVLLIGLVWNEYRMGASMFRWVPSLLDALIPFTLGGLQAALILSFRQPLPWIASLATFYVAAVVAFENMYRRSAEERRNAFVIERNRTFRRINVIASLTIGVGLWIMFAVHFFAGTTPGLADMVIVTIVNVLFLVRGEANWRSIVAAARRSASITKAQKP